MKGYIADVEDQTEENPSFRPVLYSGEHIQPVRTRHPRAAQEGVLPELRDDACRNLRRRVAPAPSGSYCNKGDTAAPDVLGLWRRWQIDRHAGIGADFNQQTDVMASRSIDMEHGASFWGIVNGTGRYAIRINTHIIDCRGENYWGRCRISGFPPSPTWALFWCWRPSRQIRSYRAAWDRSSAELSVCCQAVAREAVCLPVYRTHRRQGPNHYRHACPQRTLQDQSRVCQSPRRGRWLKAGRLPQAFRQDRSLPRILIPRTTFHFSSCLRSFKYLASPSYHETLHSWPSKNSGRQNYPLKYRPGMQRVC